MLKIILVILTAMFAFFIPGYLLINLFKIKEHKIALGIGLSICITTIISIILFLLPISKRYWILAPIIFSTFIVISLIMLFFVKKTIFKTIKDDWKKFNQTNPIWTITSIVAFVAIFLAVFMVHLNYPGDIRYVNNQEPDTGWYKLPYHNDEWIHTTQIDVMLFRTNLAFSNPYLKARPFHENYEFGFHSFSGIFFFMINERPLNIVQFLPGIFAAITAMLIFTFLFQLTKSKWAGLFGVIFFTAIPTNTSLLGTWFYVPVSMSLFLIFLFLNLLILLDKDLKLFWLLIIVLITSLTLYPFVAILCGFALIAHYFSNQTLRKQINKKKLIYGLASIIILIMATIIIIGFEKFLSFLIFEQGWSAVEITFSPFALLNIITILFGAIGIYYSFKKKIPLIAYLAGIISIIITIYYLTNVSLLFIYRVSSYYFLLLTSILAAIGLNYLIENIIKEKKFVTVVNIFITIVIIFILFNNYYTISEPENQLYRLVNQKQLDALESIPKQYVYENMMIELKYSPAMYLLSPNYVVALQSSNMGGGLTEDVHEFFSNSDCNRKEELLKIDDAKIVVSENPITCEFLKLYTAKGFYIYTYET